MNKYMWNALLALSLTLAVSTCAEPTYEDTQVYRATVTNIVDGDTFDCKILLGFGVSVEKRIRVLGLQAPEKTGATKFEGLVAMGAAISVLDNKVVLLKTNHLKEHDSFGRVLAEVWFGGIGEWQDFTKWMIELGHGKEYKK